jgi:uncharacterized membrane protein HdeD (DUF308 family)
MARKSLPGSNALMWAGIALLLLGVLLLLAPVAVGDAVVRVVALVLAVTGVVHVLQSLRAPSAMHKTVSVVLGAIVAGVGVLVWFNPELGSGFLTALLMIFFVVNALWKISTALRLRPLPNWWLLVLSGLLSLLLAALLWNQWPVSGAWVIGVLVGVDMLATGIAMIVLALGRKKKGSSDFVDTINL